MGKIRVNPRDWLELQQTLRQIEQLIENLEPGEPGGPGGPHLLGDTEVHTDVISADYSEGFVLWSKGANSHYKGQLFEHDKMAASSVTSNQHHPRYHAAPGTTQDHITGRVDEIDGDKLDIDWNPSNYAPALASGYADDLDNLTAHLKGIDAILATANAHPILDNDVHTDTALAAVTQGGLMVGKTATPEWDLLTVGNANEVLEADGTDVAWATKIHTLHSTHHSNVNAGSPSDDQVLTWDNGTSKWIAADVASLATAQHTILDNDVHTDTADHDGAMARGDLMVVRDSAVWERMGKGSSGDLLQMLDANDPGWATLTGFNTINVTGDDAVADQMEDTVSITGVSGKITVTGSAGPVIDFDVDESAFAGNLTVENDNVQVGQSDIATLDFSAQFTLGEDPDTEINIALDVDDPTPNNGATTTPISSNWAFDHDADADAHHAESHDIESHSDVTLTDIANDEVLVWETDHWENQAQAGGGVAAHDLLNADEHPDTTNVGSVSRGAVIVGTDGAEWDEEVPEHPEYLPFLMINSDGDAAWMDIEDLSEDESPHGDDFVMTWDASEEKHVQVKISNLPGAMDHGDLDGLGDDDHDFYMLEAGTVTDNTVVRFDGTGGRDVQDSGVVIDDSDVCSGMTQLTVDNLRLDGNTLSSWDTNEDVNLTPNGTGDLVLDGQNWPQIAGNATEFLVTDGTDSLWRMISGLAENSAPVAADLVMTYDASNTDHRKTTVAELLATQGCGRSQSKGLFIEDPEITDEFFIMVVDEATTIDEVFGVTTGGTSYTSNLAIRARTSPFTGGSQVMTADLVAVAGGDDSSTFDDDTMAADDTLWFVADSMNGVVEKFLLVVTFHKT